MGDQLLAIAILFGMGCGLFWLRHLLLTVAKRKSNTFPMRFASDEDSGGDDLPTHEATPAAIAWLTPSDVEPSPDDEFAETVPASVEHPGRSPFVAE